MYGACTDMRANIHTHKINLFKHAFGPRYRGTPIVLELINQKQEDHEFKSKVVWALGSVVRLPQNQGSKQNTGAFGFLLLKVQRIEFCVVT